MGQNVLESISPAQMVIKIVHDQLVELLGAEATEISLNTQPPAVILMVGLQGAGKTTTTAACSLADPENKVLLACRRIPSSSSRATGHSAQQVNVPSLKLFQARNP